MRSTLRLGSVCVLVLGLAAPTPAVAAPAPTPAPDGERPAPDRERPREALPEDRPFTGDPGGEPPPPPVRPRETVRKRPARPVRPARPADPKKPETPVVRDLLRARGPNIVAAGVGMAAGFTEHTNGGFRLNVEWSYQLTRIIWFDVIGGVSLGGKCKVLEQDANDRVINSSCNAFGGIGLDLLAGLQFKFVHIRLWKAPVVPFVRVGLGVAAIIADTPNDGAAIVARVGGGFRYYFTNWFSLGAELAFTLGPAFRNHLDPGMYAKLELLAGVEFLF